MYQISFWMLKILGKLFKFQYTVWYKYILFTNCFNISKFQYQLSSTNEKTIIYVPSFKNIFKGWPMDIIIFWPWGKLLLWSWPLGRAWTLWYSLVITTIQWQHFMRTTWAFGHGRDYTTYSLFKSQLSLTTYGYIESFHYWAQKTYREETTEDFLHPS